MIVTLLRGLLYSTLSNTPQQIAEKALAATVSLEIKDTNDAILSRGSGFFVRHNLIATNYHVIKKAAQSTAKLVGERTRYTIEGITATDETNDLVLLKVTAQGINPLPLGDSDTVRIGDTVYVVGNPKGFEGTFSNGIISSVREGHNKKELQMTAPISPGSSGGPVLNDKGEVIGVSVRIYPGQGAQNLNFASHSNALKRLLARSGLVKSLSRRKSAILIKIYLLRGSKKEKLGDYKGAIADYTKAIRLGPDNARAYYSRGIAKGKLGQHFAAIADYDTAIQLKPDYANTYYKRGNAKFDLGQYLSAIADYDTAIGFNSDDVIAYYSRGIAKERLGQYVAAIADYDTVIRLKPDFAYAYHNRGIVKGKLGQHFAAIADYDTAIQLKPDYAKAYYNRSIAKWRLARLWEAKQDLRTALKLAIRDGNNSLKADIEEVLKIIDR